MPIGNGYITIEGIIKIAISLVPLALTIWMTIIIYRTYKFTENTLRIQLEQKKEQKELIEKINKILEKEENHNFSRKI